jgi:hypothetical protein
MINELILYANLRYETGNSIDSEKRKNCMLHFFLDNASTNIFLLPFRYFTSQSR